MLDVTRRSALGALAGALAGPSFFAKMAGAQGAKVLVAALEEDPPIINPAISSAISNYVVGTPVYSGLIWMDRPGQIYPDLAESWDISPDGRVYTFRLRKGVTYHDGAPFTARDVQFSLGQLTAKIHPSAKGAYKALDRIDVVDDYTVQVVMKQPTAAYLNVPTALGPILPRHLWEGTDILKNPLNKRPVGTGPFKLVEYRPGDRFRLVRNEKYHIPGEPAFDELVIRIIPDAASRVAAFEKGDVDCLFPTAVPTTEIQRLKRMPGVALKFAELNGSCWVGNINGRNEPYSDKRVRKALAHAIDRAFIRENVLPGISWLQVGPLPPASPLYNKTLKDYEFDPRKAMALLDEAGFKPKADGTRFDFRFLWTPADIRITKMGEVIARNLSAVGIRPVLQPLERGALNQRGYIGSEYDMIIDSFALGPDPDIGVERLYRSDNILPQPFVNNSAYKNPEVDRLFDDQRVQLEFAKRKEIYDKIQEIIWEDIPVFPVAAYSGPAAVNESYARGAFETYNNNIESFAKAKPAKA